MSKQEDVYVVLVYTGEVPDEFTDDEGDIIPERRRDAILALTQAGSQSRTESMAYVSSGWSFEAAFSDQAAAVSFASAIARLDQSVLVTIRQLQDKPPHGVYSCINYDYSFIPEAGALSDSQ